MTEINEQKEESKEIEELGLTPIVIIEFSSKAHRACVEWFLSRLSEKSFYGGAELQVTPINDEETVFGLNISDPVIVSTAHRQQLKILKSDNLLYLVEAEDVDMISIAQRQQMIEFRIDCLKAEEWAPLPGYENIKPDMGKPLISTLQQHGIIEQIFPLHNPADRDALQKFWIGSTAPYLRIEAVDRLRTYFGDEVAVYFAFVRQLVLFLLPPATMPFFDCLWPSHIVSRQAAIATFNMVWLTIFIECWKRTSSQLAFRWGTINRQTLEQPRPAFFGSRRVSPVTGKVERYYAKWKRRMRFWCVSIPIMILCFQLTFSLMIGYMWLDEYTSSYAAKNPSWLSSVLMILPGVGYSILLICMNSGFRTLARLLNDFENHRLQSAYDSHYVMKLITFHSINGFLCLFYKGFYMRDLQAVKDTLATHLITSQIVSQVMESIMPLVTYHINKYRVADTHESKEFECLNKRIEKESLMPKVEGTIDEYIELYLQFGYVFLFSSLLPWAAICALVNNMVELKSDAFKLCRLYQRPFAKIASGIGAWSYGFQFLAYLAVATNCGLLYLSPEVQQSTEKNSNAFAVFACFVLFEHLIICLKVGIAAIVPDQPKDVRQSLAKQEYQSQKALRDEIKRDAVSRLKKEE